jgi:hypothetical protein
LEEKGGGEGTREGRSGEERNMYLRARVDTLFCAAHWFIDCQVHNRPSSMLSLSLSFSLSLTIILTYFLTPGVNSEAIRQPASQLLRSLPPFIRFNSVSGFGMPHFRRTAALLSPAGSSLSRLKWPRQGHATDPQLRSKKSALASRPKSSAQLHVCMRVYAMITNAGDQGSPPPALSLPGPPLSISLTAHPMILFQPIASSSDHPICPARDTNEHGTSIKHVISDKQGNSEAEETLAALPLSWTLWR